MSNKNMLKPLATGEFDQWHTFDEDTAAGANRAFVTAAWGIGGRTPCADTFGLDERSVAIARRGLASFAFDYSFLTVVKA